MLLAVCAQVGCTLFGEAGVLLEEAVVDKVLQIA
jgi:hypothetical protein